MIERWHFGLTGKMNDIVEGPRVSSATAVSGTKNSAEPPFSKQPHIVAEVIIEADHWNEIGRVDRLVHNACQAVSSHKIGLNVRSPRRVTVVLSTNNNIAKLNGQFRGKPTPTNVLSFPASASADPHEETVDYIGDIIMAAETTFDEARKLKIPPAHHLQHLVVHALLHLLGYDHADDRTAIEMETLETKILATLSIPDPYANATATDNELSPMKERHSITE